MTAAELRLMRELFSAKVAQLQRIVPTCEHCRHFAQAPICAKFGAAPPEDFRRTPEACPDWEWDSVPF